MPPSYFNFCVRKGFGFVCRISSLIMLYGEISVREDHDVKRIEARLILWLVILITPGYLLPSLAGSLTFGRWGITTAWLLSLIVFFAYSLIILAVAWRFGINRLIVRLARVVQVFNRQNTGETLKDAAGARTLEDYVKWLSGGIEKVETSQTEYIRNLERVNAELTRVHEILEFSPVVFFEWPMALHLPATYVSPNINRFGYSAEEILSGKVGFYDLVHPDDADRVRRMVSKARENHLSQYTYMYRIVTRDKDIRWVEDWTVLVWKENGELNCEKGLLRDVTEEVTLNDRARESSVRYRELFENASALIFTCDLNGRFTSANRECLELLGLNWNQLKEMTIYDILDAEHESMDLQDFAYLEMYLNSPVELRIVNAYSEQKVIELRNSLLYNGEIPNEIQSVAHDITERKAAERKIEYLTYHDRLTGLNNRLYFDMKLKEFQERQIQPLSIIIGDMNGLKLANDAFGHSVGDQLLIRIANIMDDSASDINGIVARLSGDEFAILLPEIGKVGANMVCERIREGCEDALAGGIKPSIALGFSAWSIDQNTVEEALREAEDNMYHNKLNESKSIRSAIIHSLQASLEEKTTETRSHAERLRTLALKLGKRMNLGANAMDELALAAVMHDIGKIGIPDSVLTKPEALDEEEWQVMKKHPEVGYHIILSSPNMSKVAEFILCHHERWDGTGYPQGLQRDSIPLISRIIAVVDSYDVMTSDRPYKTAISSEEALAEIERCAGTQFDPTIASVFVEMMRSDPYLG